MRRESLLVPLLLLASPAAAEMLLYIRNGNQTAVAVQVFSQAGDETWPGGDEVWLFEAGQKKKTVPISCTPGERICYGAWVNGNDAISWGVGPDGDKDCKRCCLICLSSGIEAIDLPLAQ